jgi:dihydropyrimidinase
MSVIIRNGRVVTAERDFQADIYIEAETITAIGENLRIQADRAIDATGKYVIPGGIDVHTHSFE